MEDFVGVGVDGCRGGWVAAVVNSQGCFERLQFSKTLSQLVEELPSSKEVFVDMPIGLPDRRIPSRLCDTLARKALGKKSSSIFSPPTRAALDAGSYFEACAINQRQVGRKISKQCWNIVSKMKEVDALVPEVPFIESHPELCFLGLAGTAVLASKTSSEGRTTRLQILGHYEKSAESFFADKVGAYPKSMVSWDDIVDAMVLALVNHLSRKHPKALVSLPPEPERDQEGRMMRLCFVQAECL